MKHKCLVLMLLVLVMLCACLTGAVAEESRETFTSGDYEYALLDDGTVEITKYKVSVEALDIPDMLDGRKVTSIGDNAFSSCGSLTFITIPDSIISIGNHAFSDCRFLRSISIPNSIISIGSSAFSSCISLASITIPDSVIFIGDRAFDSCNALTSVFIPASVTQIGINPFASCQSLKSISISPDNPYFSVIDNALFRNADDSLIASPARIQVSAYHIPQGTVSISASAFCPLYRRPCFLLLRLSNFHFHSQFRSLHR